MISIYNIHKSSNTNIHYLCYSHTRTSPVKMYCQTNLQEDNTCHIKIQFPNIEDLYFSCIPYLVQNIVDANFNNTNIQQEREYTRDLYTCHKYWSTKFGLESFNAYPASPQRNAYPKKIWLLIPKIQTRSGIEEKSRSSKLRNNILEQEF